MSDRITVTVSPDRLQVSPGSVAQATVTVKNAGDVVEAYSITSEGMDPAWCALSVSSVSLFPGDAEQIQLTVQPPKVSASKAGSYTVTIKVASNRDPTLETTAQVVVDLGRVLAFDVDLSPKKARARKGSYTLTISNSGNVAATYTFAGNDPENLCRFSFEPSSLVVEPGATAEVPVVVDPKKKPFTGRSKNYSFTITVTSHASEEGETKTVQGELECRPAMPRWAIVLVSLVVVAAVAAAVVLVLMLRGNAPVIDNLSVDVNPVGVGRTCTLTCTASDADEDELTYEWTADDGDVTPAGNVATWEAHDTPGEYTVRVVVDDGTGRTVEGSVVISVILTTGDIDVDSSPPGARVYLDGDDTGNITPYVITGVEQGEHTIRLARAESKDREETVTVVAGETAYVNWELTPAPAQTVTLQPGPATGKDSFVSENDPTYAMGGPMSWFVATLVTAGNDATKDCRAYLEFDVSTIPSTAVVTMARLGLFHDLSDAGATNGPVGAFEVTSDWDDEALIWIDIPTTAADPVDTVTLTMPASHGFVFWEIDGLVQGWVDGSVDNYGVMLADVDESTSEGWKWFYSADFGNAAQRPKLVITYYDPEP
ncbi:MAG: DNRLRE domain-containing protein [Chloroflexota bacterium]|nr:DNRLRE domain-containing protein [Chloroflexota bacterium]